MCVGVPGQVTAGSTVVKFAPNLDWRDVDVREFLPPAWRWPVMLENDVRMGTFGEFSCGAARGCGRCSASSSAPASAAA